MALGLVNTIDMLEDPPDFLRSVDSLQRLLRHLGLDGASPSLSDADLDRVRHFRDRITLAMDSDEVAAGKILSDLAEGLDLRPRLVPTHTATWEIRFGAGAEDGLEALFSSVVMGLMELLVGGRWDTIGRCAGAPCCCLFVDRTRNRNRRFCCQLCADRVNQAKARQRNQR